MEKKTTTLFFLRKYKHPATDQYPIYLRVTVEGERMFGVHNEAFQKTDGLLLQAV